MGLGMVNVDLKGILNGLGNVGGLFTSIREAITGKKILDPVKLAEIEAGLKEIELGLSTAQTKINEAEAKSKSIFVSGWRPFVGWICASAFGLHFLIFPIARVVIKLFKSTFEFPVFDIGTLVTVLMGMLGLGFYRSLEKKWSVQDKH